MARTGDSSRRSRLLRARLTAQGLAGPPLGAGADGPVAVARRLLAVQAQDPRGARLAVRARTRATVAADVDRALGEDRTLVLTWLNRGTLHLVCADDYPLLQTLTTPPLRTGTARRLAQCGVSADATDRALGLVDGWLTQDGPLGREELRARLERAGIPVAGQALVHLLFRASLDGVLVRGPMDGDSPTEQRYARVADWLPEVPAQLTRLAGERDRPRLLAELALRYLRGHGPADARDLAKWAGITLGDARRGLERLGGTLRQEPGKLITLADASSPARLPPPRLLGPFDALLMGWRSRELVLGAHEARVVTGGIFRGSAFAGGATVGVWRFAGPRVALEPFAALPEPTARALARDGEAVTRFLGRGGRRPLRSGSAGGQRAGG